MACVDQRAACTMPSLEVYVTDAPAFECVRVSSSMLVVVSPCTLAVVAVGERGMYGEATWKTDICSCLKSCVAGITILE